ncbi:hypothetical protein CYMTET_32499 [Cymbomonas tetramitiformis]|uniref:Uncharacterized protein n=1 Tax=Cymbomonas tetramitiformis TaxID=36881 RepID=A0AAE0KS49_9CHLO|nr:hypothetical protein CYMTET_32499 [Cymbomonas tetramitiformis]
MSKALCLGAAVIDLVLGVVIIGFMLRERKAVRRHMLGAVDLGLVLKADVKGLVLEAAVKRIVRGAAVKGHILGAANIGLLLRAVIIGLVVKAVVIGLVVLC